MSEAPSPDDLGILDQQPRRVMLSSGLTVDVRPLVVRQLAPFVRALGPARDMLAAPDVDLWDLIADYGEDITEALGIALGLSREAIEDLSPEDYLDCFNAVLEANRDFFARWLLPRAMAAARAKAREDGQTSFSNLSVPVTP